MPRTHRTPTQLRMIFGDNLRQLARTYPSISELSRQLGINRTQFNRYLSGESFPRPDVLDRICSFFGTDARILLHPVAAIADPAPCSDTEFLQEFLSLGKRDLTKKALPSGLYQVTRPASAAAGGFVTGLLLVLRQNGRVFVRGYAAQTRQTNRREFRGQATRQCDGLLLITAQRGATSCQSTYLSQCSDSATIWTGHICSLPTSEGPHVTPVVYEYLGQDRSRILQVARLSGALAAHQLSDLQQAHLTRDHALT